MLEIVSHSNNFRATPATKSRLHGASANLLPGGMLVVSLGSHAFSKRRVVEMAMLGLQHCEDFAIVLADHPSRLNWPLATTPSPERHQKLWMQMSNEKRHGYQHAVRAASLSDRVSILSWLELLEDPLYHRNLRVLTKAFTSDIAFHDAVVRQTQHNLSGKISDVERQRNRVLSLVERNCLYQFLLEELSGIFYMQFDRKYYLDIYPGEPMEIIKRIYNNAFPDITDSLQYDWSRQVWLRV